MLTAGTGQGKLTLLFAPLLAKREVDSKVVGLSVAPTKALGEDQVCSVVVCAVLYISFRHVYTAGTFFHIERDPRHCNQSGLTL